MINVGDYVAHTVIPPGEGKVILVQPQIGLPNKICVQLDSGRLLWDIEDTWEIVEGVDSSGDILDEDGAIITAEEGNGFRTL